MALNRRINSQPEKLSACADSVAVTNIGVGRQFLWLRIYSPVWISAHRVFALELFVQFVGRNFDQNRLSVRANAGILDFRQIIDEALH